ncbi:MAG: Gfo/Idh/MocA family oxidoreductase, partial [Candidatus Latescibacteria bacterium]|nr:Gfo/Idh/MocA family oxidoreductase [Candidatus Latescibacterota bacterium]
MAISKPYRVGLVGCGGMGRHHLNTIRQLSGFDIVALCDIASEALNRAGEEYGITARYRDFEKMYE